MPDYRLIPTRVQAWQWVPGGLVATGIVVGILMGHGVHFAHPSGLGPTTTLLIEGGAGEQIANPGDWVVKDADDQWSVIEATEFAMSYEPAATLPGIA